MSFCFKIFIVYKIASFCFKIFNAFTVYILIFFVCLLLKSIFESDIHVYYFFFFQTHWNGYYFSVFPSCALYSWFKKKKSKCDFSLLKKAFLSILAMIWIFYTDLEPLAKYVFGDVFLIRCIRCFSLFLIYFYTKCKC